MTDCEAAFVGLALQMAICNFHCLSSLALQNSLDSHFCQGKKLVFMIFIAILSFLGFSVTIPKKTVTLYVQKTPFV